MNTNTEHAAAFFTEDGIFIGKYAPAGPPPAVWLTVFTESRREAESVRAALAAGRCPAIPAVQELVRGNDMRPYFTAAGPEEE